MAVAVGARVSKPPSDSDQRPAPVPAQSRPHRPSESSSKLALNETQLRVQVLCARLVAPMMPASDAKNLPLLLGPYGRSDSAGFAVKPSQSPVDLDSAEQNGPKHRHAEPQWLDRVGITLSALCAIHCALTPILVAVAPLLFTAEFEFKTKALLLALAGVALGWGFLTHRSWRPMWWLGAALVAFGVAEWLGHAEHHAGHTVAHGSGEWLEVGVTVLASAALIMAHVANTHACRSGAPNHHAVSLLRRKK